MPSCCIINCNRVDDGHSFPEDPNLRMLWLSAINRPNFVPKDASVVCAEHFTKDDFIKDNSLKKGAVPSVSLMIELSDESNEQMEAEVPHPKTRKKSAKPKSRKKLCKIAPAPSEDRVNKTKSSISVIATSNIPVTASHTETPVLANASQTSTAASIVPVTSFRLGNNLLTTTQATPIRRLSNNGSSSVTLNLPVLNRLNTIKPLVVTVSKGQKAEDKSQASHANIDGGSNMNRYCMSLLTTNVLPPYVPRKPPSFTYVNGKCFLKYHPCDICGNTYVLKHNYKDHIERRTMLIRFKCKPCGNKDLIFHNRCIFLTHIRVHKEKNEPHDFIHAMVSPLPKSLLFGNLQRWSDDELYKAVNAPPDTEFKEMLDFSTEWDLDELFKDNVEDDMTEIGKDNDGIEFEDVEELSYKCADCNEMFATTEFRAMHLTNGGMLPDPATNTLCLTCNLLLPSRCSLKAHQRIHIQISPYVCPECGDSPSPVWETFQRHVKYHCFHGSRTVGYKCPQCGRYTPSKNALLNHMESHFNTYAKCSWCPNAFLTSDALKIHLRVAHPGRQEIKYLYVCSICNTSFVKKVEMVKHRSEHLKEQVCQYVFNCMKCAQQFNSKPELLDHIRIAHAPLYANIAPLFKSQNEGDVLVADGNMLEDMDLIDSEELLQVEPIATVQCMLCLICSDNYRSYQSHLVSTHKHNVYICKACSYSTDNRRAMVKHGKDHILLGVKVCLLCDNTRMASSKTLQIHLVEHIRLLSNTSYCPICNEKLGSLRNCLQHLLKEHSSSLPIDVLEDIISVPSTASSRKNFECGTCIGSFGTLHELKQHAKLHQDEPQISTPEDHTTPSKGDKQPESICKTSSTQNSSFPSKLDATQTSTVPDKQNQTLPTTDGRNCAQTPNKQNQTLPTTDGRNRTQTPNKQTSVTPSKQSSTPNKQAASRPIYDGAEDIPRNGNTCGWCSVPYADREAFKAHIKTHKEDPWSSQCQECGDCLITEDGLVKHLLIAHRIRNGKRYMEREGTNRVQEENQEADPDANICHVCLQTFKSDKDLEMHMRKHGVAFIQSRMSS